MEPLDYLQVPGWRLWRSWWGWRPTVQPSTYPRWVAPTFRQIRSGRVRRNPARRLWSCPRNQGLFGSNISGQTDYSTGKFDVYVYKEVRKQKVHLLFFLQFSNRWWMPNSIFATPKIDQNLSFLAVFFLYIVLEVLREVLLLGAVWIVLLSPFSYMGKTFDDMYHLFSIFVSITG